MKDSLGRQWTLLYQCICLCMLFDVRYFCFSKFVVTFVCLFALDQVMANVTAGSVSATLAISATTVTAPRRRRPASRRMDRCAADGEAASAAAVSALSPVRSETPVRNVPPALMPAERKGDVKTKKFTLDYGRL